MTALPPRPEVEQSQPRSTATTMRNHTPKPLYRKVNTTAHRVRHNHGGEYRDQATRGGDLEALPLHESMQGSQRRGLDYTPLFKFLLSKAGQPWASVLAEASRRIDRPDPIYWLVRSAPEASANYVRVGESSYYSALHVDDHGILRISDPSLGPSSLAPGCRCCTHTFNGIPFTQVLKPAD